MMKKALWRQYPGPELEFGDAPLGRINVGNYHIGESKDKLHIDLIKYQHETIDMSM